MSDLKVCRVCLRTNTKMYKYDQFKLKSYYENVMAAKVNEKEDLPCYFCYECASLIHKFHKFKEKCYRGQHVLKEILWRGGITWKAVSKVDREKFSLRSSIDIINISNKVRTCVVKHDRSINSQKPKVIEEPVTNPEVIDVQLDCDVESLKSDDFDDFEADKDVVGDKEIVNDKEINADEQEIPKEIINCDIKEEKIDDETLTHEAKEIEIEERINLIKEDIHIPSNENYNISKENKIKNGKKKLKSIKKKGANFTKSKKKKEGRITAVEAEKFKSSIKKKQELDSRNWQKFNLPEEEAVKEFQARAQDPKYINAIYKCTGCLKGFSKEDMMKRHIKLRHSESNGSVECRFCRIRFKWKSLLSRHIREHYNKYKCLRCDLIFSRETSAHHHDQFHNGVTRTCEYCNEKFTHLSTYYTHLRKHRSKHLCTLCGESFVSEFGLYMHRRVKHIMDTENQDSVAAETTYCERCDIKFETNKAYEEHLIHSAMHSASEETPTLMNLKGGTVIRRAPRKHTKCTICNRNFSTLVAYMKHHGAEHPGAPLPLGAVTKPHHAAGAHHDRHICEICGALLAPNSIYSHVNTHTRERQFTCTTCGMQFNAKGTLQRHYLTHTGEKPVECSLCDKRFTQVASMRLHYRTIHLKQPYPKRSRRKKAGDPDETAVIAQYYQNKEPPEDMTLDRWRTMRL